MIPHHQHVPATPSRAQRSRATTATATTPSGASGSHRRGLYAYVGHRVVELLSERQLVDHAVSVLPQLRSVAARPHFHGPHWTTLRKKNGVELFEFDPAAHGATLAPATTSRRSTIYTPRTRLPPVPSTSSLAPTAAASAVSSTAPHTHLDSAAHTPMTRASTLPHGFQTKFKLPNPGIDMSYAAIAQCELEGGVADVVDALFNDDAVEFEASMKALWAGKLKRGDLLLARTVTTATPMSARSTNNLDELQVPEPGRLAIKTATVGAGLRLTHRQIGAEKLCYTSFTQAMPSTNEVFHVVKTLPLDVHDQIACDRTHVALCDASVDHIAVGYLLTGIDSMLGGKRTRLVVCAYASSAVSTTTVTRASQLHWHPRMGHGGSFRGGGGGGEPGGEGVNADVRRIVMMLAKAARGFQQIIRQRRFGHQRFVYFPTDRHSGRALEQSCVVCLKRFGLFRKDHYCQLCGHLVCRQCSKKHKVEPLAGKVRENRICFPCVARVDSGTFQDEQLWRSMTRPVVVDADVISPEDHDPILEMLEDGVDTPAALYQYQHHQYQQQHGRGIGSERDRGCRNSPRMSPIELTTEQQPHDDEEDDDMPEFDRSFGSAGSASTASSSARREIQVAQDLFSPHPQRRASALEALSRVVLDARNSVEHTSNYYGLTPTAAARVTLGSFTATTPRAMDPLVVDKYLDDQHRPLSTKSDLMQTFDMCYPHANPTTDHSYAPKTALLECVEQHQSRGSFRLPLRRSHAVPKIDTAAFNSICEAVVQRLGYCIVFLVVQRSKGKRQVVGMHQASQIRDRLPRHADLASYCPSGFVSSSRPSIVVIDPTHDIRFSPFALVHDARIRFFAEFALPGIHGHPTITAASLCVMDTSLRGQDIAKQEIKTVKTLCTVASDLISAIAH